MSVMVKYFMIRYNHYINKDLFKFCYVLVCLNGRGCISISHTIFNNIKISNVCINSKFFTVRIILAALYMAIQNLLFRYKVGYI